MANKIKILIKIWKNKISFVFTMLALKLSFKGGRFRGFFFFLGFTASCLLPLLDHERTFDYRYIDYLLRSF